MKPYRSSLEILEARIAPAVVLPTDPNSYVKATLGGPNLVQAGQVLTTGGQDSGSYLLMVEKGAAYVYFTDLNNNTQIDFNELTGIAAGDGLRLVSFVDIHGDIVTNLKKTVSVFKGGFTTTSFSLSDSNSNASDDLGTGSGGDGRVLLNSTIEKIELRALSPADVGDLNGDGDADDADVAIHQTTTTVSIYGNIYAGRAFGTADGKGGLIIDAGDAAPFNFGFAVRPTIGSIKTGTAATGEYFTFGNSNLNDISGTILPFNPPRGQAGADINGVKVNNSQTLNLNTIHAGDGGIGGRGGNVANVVIPLDDSGGYEIIAGNGGAGPSGGNGGSVLNFTDKGSLTALVTIRSGDGGAGATGTGGDGGNFSFGTFNVRGDVQLFLGNGGTGFTAGGDGASLTKGNFTQPDDLVGYRAGSSYGTTHISSSKDPNPFDADDATRYMSNKIGTHQAIDFNADGFGDYVYTTLDTSQVVVALGDRNGTFFKVDPVTQQFLQDPAGNFILNTIALSGVRNPEAITVADLDADGHPDIAVGSMDQDNHAGVVVFLSRYSTVVTPTGTVDRFQGFRDARFSPLPQLQSGDPDVYDDFSESFPYAKSPHQISSLAAGDFNGDGRIEIAAVVTQYGLEESDPNGIVDTLDEIDQVIVFMTQDYEIDSLDAILLDANSNPVLDAQGNTIAKFKPTGTFYADFGDKAISTATADLPPRPQLPFISTFQTDAALTPGSVIIEASPLSTTSGYDSLFVANRGLNDVLTYDYRIRNVPTGGGNSIAVLPQVRGAFDLGSVDSERQTGADKIVVAEFLSLDFSVTDYNNDGRADLIAISPDRFLVGVAGNGLGAGAQDSGNGSSQSGVFYGPAVGGGGGFGLVTGGTLVALRTLDLQNDGTANDVYVLDDLNALGTRITLLDFQPGVSTTLAPSLIFSNQSANATPTTDVSFDIHFLNAINPNSPTGPMAGAALLDGADNIQFEGPGMGLGRFLPMSHTGFLATAGNGGDSLVGRGGNGGGLGGGVLTKTATGGPNAATGVLNFTYAGDLSLFSGNGGDGFSQGGNGGVISGVSVRYRGGNDIGLGVAVASGDGGRGVSGAGGDGGNIASNSFETALRSTTAISSNFSNFNYTVTESAGNGGDGARGGRGGSVVGNGVGVFDALGTFLNVTGGEGGNGSRGGGNGGGISGLKPTFPPPANVSGSLAGGGVIVYLAGNGGDAVSGPGGNGGSISKSSPAFNAFVDGQLIMIAGDAGDGLSGGKGGSASDFNLKLSALSVTPAQVTVHAGNGGSGVSGDGGAGGGVSNVSVPSRGTAGPFNAVLAGNGGESAGKTGGAGGTISNVSVSSTQGAIAVAAGAGGNGLLRGGDGGAVQSTNVATGGGTQAKVLVIAGAGGDATAFIVNSNDGALNQAEKAFGGKVGQGGAGGNINGITQNGGQNGGNVRAHFDLIAGNGGSTSNYGTFFDSKSFVGRGGSVMNVRITGDFGNIDADRSNTPGENENVPIKSYNDTQAGETIADFVRDNLRNSNTVLNDATGNVGIVVGAAGRNKSVIENPVDKPEVFVPRNAVSQTGSAVVNGSLMNIRGSNLMSAVAGSVDSIAAIQLARDIFITGDTSSDKGIVAPNGTVFPVLPGGFVPDDGYVNNPDYLDKDGNRVLSPEIGAKLIDGILATKKFQVFDPNSGKYIDVASGGAVKILG